MQENHTGTISQNSMLGRLTKPVRPEAVEPFTANKTTIVSHFGSVRVKALNVWL